MPSRFNNFFSHYLKDKKGQEKDVVVFSAVRASPNLKGTVDRKNLIGFLSDVRRLNVAITRPRFVLLVVGKNIWKSLK